MAKKPCLYCLEAAPHDGHTTACREESAIRNAQLQWNKKMAALLAKDPKPYRPTMPKGEVT